MNLSSLPALAFVDPDGSNCREIDRLGRRVLATLLSRISDATGRSPLPTCARPPEFRSIAETPTSERELLAQLQDIISASMNIAHPGYIGHMNSMPTTMSILGDVIVSALNNNMLSLEMSPVFSRMEASLMRWFAELFGLGRESGGILVSSGTLANLQALAVARNARLGVLVRGLAGSEKTPCILCSEVAHASITKAAMLLGLGTSGVILVATNADSQMEAESLRAAIASAGAANREPFCVVATAGTTITGNIDPLVEIRRIANEHGLWFHVDAAYGGALIFSAQQRHRLAGIEDADSLTFNPQKWLYITNSCAMVLFRHQERMTEVFRIPSPYMQETEGFINLGEISVHGSRRVEVLKLWLSLQHVGRRGYEQLVDEGCRLSGYLRRRIEERAFLQIAARAEMNILCFRGVPAWLEPAAWDNWNSKLQSYLLRECDFFLSLPPYRGARWLRAVLLNPYADEALIDRLLAHIDNFAAHSKSHEPARIAG